jgi:hypothetical protein
LSKPLYFRFSSATRFGFSRAFFYGALPFFFGALPFY